MRRRPVRRIGRAVQVSWFAAVAGGILSFVLEVTANQLSVLGRWAPWAVMVGGSVLALALWTAQHVWAADAPLEMPLARPLPHADELLGRDRTVEAVVERAVTHGVVMVQGPDGIGTSSVAIQAARQLVPAEPDQRYVDLRGVGPDDARSALLRVLRTLGLEARGSEARARRMVADRLRDSRTVLVIDNVTGVRQVAWLAEPVPGAFVIMAGEIRSGDLPGAAHVPVPGLDPEDALALLRRQDAEPRPRRLVRVLDRVLGAPRHTIDARIAAERDDAATLAARYLRHPRVAVQLGRWLARNPQVSIARLLRDLDGGGVVSELRKILGEMLAGASPGARQLLGLLVTVPEVEYTDAAIAALAGTSAERAGEQLAELGERFLVHRTSSGSRVARQAAQIADPVTVRAVAKARTRLLGHYASRAGVNAELLGGEQYAEGVRWFATHDVTLQALLDMPSPPRRAAPHLWAIADALEVWFTRDGRREERRDTATVMLARARELGDTDAEAIALVRLAAIERRRRSLGEARKLLGAADALAQGRVPWLPQLRTGWALWHEATYDSDAARNEILRCMRTRPQRDLEGRTIDLINLAAIDIRDDQHASAADLLDEAARLARRAGYIGGLAHARELSGIAECARGRYELAEAAWSEAYARYGEVGDKAGQARCLRHRTVGRRPAGSA